MIQAKQMANFVCERGFEIVSAGRAVSGELQLRAVLRARSRIDTDVSFGDVAVFRIEENTRASGRCFEVERFVFGGIGNCQKTDAIARVCGTDRSRSRPRDDEVDV